MLACGYRLYYFKKITASITLIAFLATTIAQDFAWASPNAINRGESSVSSVIARSPSADAGATKQSLKSLNVSTFTLPKNLGAIRDSWQSDSSRVHEFSGSREPISRTHELTNSRTIIHIQDAHCNYAAQYKIKEIIEYLNRQYGVNTINLEGGAKDYDLSIFTGINDKAVRDKVADYFVKEGLVNGAEYYAINNPDKVKLWGIEDTKLYIENLKIYRSSLKHKEDINKYLKSLSYILANLKRHIFPKALLELDTRYTRYKAGNIEFGEYISYLFAMAREKAVDIKKFPDLYLLSQSLDQEREIDFKKANGERDLLIDRLQKILSNKELEELVVKAVEFKDENISREDFYRYLLNKAGELRIGLEDFTELKKYITYVAIYAAADKIKVMAEVDSLEACLKGLLCENQTQKELDTLSKNLALTKNLFNISLTRDDYQYYKDNKDSFGMRRFIKFIERQAPLFNITAKLDENIGDLDDRREDMARFYEYSFQRDRAFMNNIKFASSRVREFTNTRTREHTNTRTAVLVTGGFHTENLCEQFKKEGISYISIMPNFKNDDTYECPYLKILSGEKNIRLKEAVPLMLNSALATATQLSPEMVRALEGSGLEAAENAATLLSSAPKTDLIEELREFLTDGRKVMTVEYPVLALGGRAYVVYAPSPDTGKSKLRLVLLYQQIGGKGGDAEVYELDVSTATAGWRGPHPSAADLSAAHNYKTERDPGKLTWQSEMIPPGVEELERLIRQKTLSGEAAQKPRAKPAKPGMPAPSGTKPHMPGSIFGKGVFASLLISPLAEEILRVNFFDSKNWTMFVVVSLLLIAAHFNPWNWADFKEIYEAANHGVEPGLDDMIQGVSTMAIANTAINAVFAWHLTGPGYGWGSLAIFTVFFVSHIIVNIYTFVVNDFFPKAVLMPASLISAAPSITIPDKPSGTDMARKKKPAGAGKTAATADEYKGKVSLNRLKAGYGLLRQDHPVTEYVKGVLRRIYPNVAEDKLPNIEILASSGMGVNAMILRNRTIVITPEMLEFLEYEDELAFVLLHEMMHLDKEHYSKKDDVAERKSIRQSLGLDRIHEYESDGWAFDMMGEKGFNPQGGISFFVRCIEQGVSWGPVHGTDTDRLLNLMTIPYLKDYRGLSFILAGRISEEIKGSLKKIIREKGRRIERILCDRVTDEGPAAGLEERMSLAQGADMYLIQHSAVELYSKIISDIRKKQDVISRGGRITAAYDARIGENRKVLNRLLVKLDELLGAFPGKDRNSIRFILLTLLCNIPLLAAEEELKAAGLQALIDTRATFLAELEKDPPAMIDFLTGNIFEGGTAGGLAIDTAALSGFMVNLMDIALKRGPYFSREGIDLKRYLKDSFALLGAASNYAKHNGMTGFEIRKIWTEMVFRGIWSLYDVRQKGSISRYITEVYGSEYAGMVKPDCGLLRTLIAIDNLKRPSGSCTIDVELITKEMKTHDPAIISEEEAMRNEDELIRQLIHLTELSEKKLDEEAKTILPGHEMREIVHALDRIKLVRPDLFKDLVHALNLCFEKRFDWKAGREAARRQVIDYILFNRMFAPDAFKYKEALEYSDTMSFTDMSKAGFQMQDFAEISDAMDSPDAVERAFGTKPLNPDISVKFDDIGFFSAHLFMALCSELSRMDSPDEYFGMLDRYLNRWRIVSLSGFRIHADAKMELPFSFDEIVKKGLDFINRSDPQASRPETIKKIFALAFFSRDMFAKARVQEEMLTRLAASPEYNLEDILDFMEKSYCPQRPAGLMQCWEYLVEEKAETPQDMELLGKKVENLFKFNKAQTLKEAGDIIGMDAFFELVFGNKSKVLCALLKTRTDEEEFKNYLFNIWYGVFGRHVVDLPAAKRRKGKALRGWASDTPMAESYSEAKIWYYPLEDLLLLFYRMNYETKYLLLRKLLMGDGGALKTKAGRSGVLDTLFESYVDFKDTGSRGQGILKEVLETMIGEAGSEQLYFAFYPLLIGRLAVPPREPVEWLHTGEAKEAVRAAMRTPVEPYDKANCVKMMRRRLKTSIYGYSGKTKPDSIAAERLLAFLPEEKRFPVAEGISGMDLIIEIARKLGSPGVRFLQLLGQFVELPPEYSEKFLNVYDSMMGQSRLTAYQTLKRECPEFAKTIKRFGKRKGGGSIMTVYEVWVDDGKGGERKEAVKIVNPCAEYFTEQSLGLLEKVLKSLSEGDSKMAGQYKQALPLLDDLKEWIEHDLNDTTFYEDDERFRKMHENNPWIVIPRTFREKSARVFREEYIEGDNLTRMDEMGLSPDRKKEIVSTIARDYFEQIANGLVHSDVHPGNFRITPEGKIAILDRSSYIKIDDADLKMFMGVFSAQSPEERTLIFMDYLARLDANSGMLKTKRDKDKISKAVLAAIPKGETDFEKMALHIITQLKRQGVKVPLKIALLVKNLHVLSRWSRSVGFASLQAALEPAAGEKPKVPLARQRRGEAKPSGTDMATTKKSAAIDKEKGLEGIFAAHPELGSALAKVTRGLAGGDAERMRGVFLYAANVYSLLPGILDNTRQFEGQRFVFLPVSKNLCGITLDPAHMDKDLQSLERVTKELLRHRGFTNVEVTFYDGTIDNLVAKKPKEAAAANAIAYIDNSEIQKLPQEKRESIGQSLGLTVVRERAPPDGPGYISVGGHVVLALALLDLVNNGRSEESAYIRDVIELIKAITQNKTDYQGTGKEEFVEKIKKGELELDLPPIGKEKIDERAREFSVTEIAVGSAA